MGEESAYNAGDAGDTGSIPGSGRSPEGGNGIPLQYPCLKNPMDREAWWATVQRVTELDTTVTTFTHASPYSPKLCALSCVQLCNSMTVAPQATLSMEFSRQEY